MWGNVWKWVWVVALMVTCGAEDLEGAGADGGGVLGWIYNLWMLIAPGGKLHPAAFLENRGHLVVESVLVAVIVYLLWQPRTKPTEGGAALSEKEIDEICEEWKPEPLVPKTTTKVTSPIVAESATGPYLTVDGVDALNLVSTDFLGLSRDSEIMDNCQKVIEKYGVGSCGPRGFYGTVDVHLELEKNLAAFMEADAAIIYSFDMASGSSVIPAFANRRDILICDEAVHYPLQNGCNLSRARVETFKHNDMDDLERILQKIETEDRVEKFIIVEGIYHYLGDIAPLDKIFELKEKYCFRLIVDESLAFGVLGNKGRGACEHFNLPPGSVEIITASMSNSLASVGGFCVGDWEMVDHQRLSGLGYCFSASLPPYLATAATGALERIASDSSQRQKCVENARMLRQWLFEIPGLQVIGNEQNMMSPVILVDIQASDDANRGQKSEIMTQIIDLMRREHALITIVECSPLDWKAWGPLFRIVVTSAHTKDDLQGFADGFKSVVEKVLE